MRPGRTTFPFASYLSPGHRQSDHVSWLPPDLPLGQAEAAQFLKQLGKLSLPELETMRLITRRDYLADSIADQDEKLALAQFCGAPAPQDAFASAREMAQKLLLWRWFWEDCQEQIGSLARTCDEAEKLLPAHFLETGLPADTRASLADPEPEPDAMWRAVTANAAFFLPLETGILAEGEMARDLAERLEFEPAATASGHLRKTTAPLWQVLGHSRPARGVGEKIYNPDRVWFVWSSA